MNKSLLEMKKVYSDNNKCKVHFRQTEDLFPVCRMTGWLMDYSDNYIEVTCRKCKDTINRLYRNQTTKKGII